MRFLYHERYHGRKPPFLEGRCRTLVDAAEQHRYATVFDDTERSVGLKVAGQLEQLLA
jgi:hypothetical protein